jgi:glutamate decarboxylase
VLQSGEYDTHVINENLDSLIKAIQKQQREAGKSFVSRTRLGINAYPNECITVFRVVIANPLTTVAHLNDILEEQVKIASKVPLLNTLMTCIESVDHVTA